MPHTKEAIINTIYRAVAEVNEQLPEGQNIVPAPETSLIGSEATIDSLGLVILIVTTEREIEEEYQVSVTLADERAMSQRNSPFRTIDTLADYISLLLEEQNA